MKTYKVTIDSNGTKCWYNAKDQRHREDGPAIEWSNGYKSWYINGQQLTEAEWRAQAKQTCNGKTIVVDGKTYKLVAL
jgi:hypothetical protein